MIDNKLLKKVSTLLKKHNLKVSTAESCTGGLIAHSLTNIAGSSNYFNHAIIAYSNNAKINLLNISMNSLKKYGAVSKEVAKEMAYNVRTIFNDDIGISTTGIAGPTGGTLEKPVGLVYIGVSNKDKTIVKKFLFSGDRLQNKVSTCNTALNMVFDILIEI